MKGLILGAEGQVGRALQAAAPRGVDLLAPPRSLCDITDPAQLEEWISGKRPAIVINAAAYTAVDAAETDEAQALRVNGECVGRVAALCTRVGARFVHISTDFVFDGSASVPYAEDAAPHPLSAYGRSKYRGEQLALAENPQTLIVRTAWVHAQGGRNFVNTMLRLMQTRDEIKVVADQIGTPTYARNLAAALWRLAEDGQTGLFHFTDHGVASWYDFAVAVREEAAAAGLLTRRPAIVPIAAKDYPTPARRPAYSVLDKSKIAAKIGIGQHWREALRDMLRDGKRDG